MSAFAIFLKLKIMMLKLLNLSEFHIQDTTWMRVLQNMAFVITNHMKEVFSSWWRDTPAAMKLWLCLIGALFTVHRALFTKHCASCTRQCALFTLQCAMFTAQRLQCTVHCALCAVHCTKQNQGRTVQQCNILHQIPVECSCGGKVREIKSHTPCIKKSTMPCSCTSHLVIFSLRL